jgi:hypothetical protein
MPSMSGMPKDIPRQRGKHTAEMSEANSLVYLKHMKYARGN